jgi:hypothetical protein
MRLIRDEHGHDVIAADGDLTNLVADPGGCRGVGAPDLDVRRHADGVSTRGLASHGTPDVLIYT